MGDGWGLGAVGAGDLAGQVVGGFETVAGFGAAVELFAVLPPILAKTADRVEQGRVDDAGLDLGAEQVPIQRRSWPAACRRT